MELFTVTHPVVDGWRWAIHTNDQLHQTGVGFLGSAVEPTQVEADGVLAMVLTVVREALIVAGVASSVVAHTLADSPLDAALVAELTAVN